MISSGYRLNGRARHVHQAAAPLASDASSDGFRHEMLGDLSASAALRHGPYDAIPGDVQSNALHVPPMESSHAAGA